jgi:hypothetical protein
MNQHLVHQLSALSVMALSPVVAGARSSKDEVVGSEKLAKWARTHSVHRTGFQVHKHRAGHVLVAGCLMLARLGN